MSSAPTDYGAIFGGDTSESEGASSGYNLTQTQTPEQTTQGPLTAPAQQVAATTVMPSGGAPTGGAQGSDLGVFSPGQPSYLKYSESSQYGLNDLSNLYKSVYSNVGNDNRQAIDPYKPDNENPQNYSESTGQTDSTTATTPTDNKVADDGSYTISGNATTFGLNPNTVVNADGTVDTKYIDKEDNGYGAFGYNTRDPKLVGASLPVEVLKQSIGDYTKNPKIWSQIHNGEYKIAVTNPKTGQTEVMNIVDSGPATWTGNAVDLTYGATKKLGFTGKDNASYKLIGPDGKNIQIKGFHPSSTVTQPTKSNQPPRQREEETDVGDYPNWGFSQDMQSKVNRWKQAVKSQLGLDVVEQEGYRDPKRSDKLHASGIIASPGGYSYHNYGEALDFGFRKPDGSVDLHNESGYLKAEALAKQFGLTGISNETGHIQNADYKTVADLRKKWATQTYNPFWSRTDGGTTKVARTIRPGETVGEFADQG